MLEYRRLVLARRPAGVVRDDDFEMQSAWIGSPGAGEFIVRVCWLSFDPAQRGWLDDIPSYLPPVKLGEVMRANGVGIVVDSRNTDFPAGTLVSGTFGWQEYALLNGQGGVIPTRRVPAGVEPSAALGVLGTTGLTAYFGLLDIGRPKPGDVVVVSAAAGATGSVVGQIARLAGAKVIGIVGGKRKSSWITDVAGFDAAIDHRAEDVGARLAELAPDGINVYYDNVGGKILDAALANLALNATIVLGGAISTRYATDGNPPGVHNLYALLVKNARMEGFVALKYADRFEEGLQQLAEWLRCGKIVAAEDIQRGGLDQAPATLRRLFEGKNLGKQLLQISDPAS